MRESQNTTGIIFRLYSSKDADKVVHFINEQGSRQVMVAKGVGKPNSRKAYSIDLLNQVKLKLATGLGLPLATEVKLVRTPDVFKQSYAGFMLVNLVCEIVDVFVQEEHDEPGYYLNLDNLLQIRSDERLTLLAAAFLLRFLYISGNVPRLNEDIYGGMTLNETDPRYLTPDIGYTSQPAFAQGDNVSDRIVKAQRFILNHDFATIQKLALTPAEQLQLLTIHVNWLEVAFGKQLKSLSMFLEAVT